MRLNNWCRRCFDCGFNNSVICVFSFLCSSLLGNRFLGNCFFSSLFHRLCVATFFGGFLRRSLLRGLFYWLWLFRLYVTLQPIAFGTSANAVGLLLNDG